VSSRRRIDEERLTAASLAEFTSKSYEEASVNTIIGRAGISKGSFYYRFKTKYDLYLHLLKTGVEEKWAYIRSRMGETADAAETDEAGGVTDRGRPDIFAEFLTQARIGAEFAAEHPEYHKLSMMFSREKGTEVYADVIRDLGSHDASGLEERIRTALRDGEIRSGFSEEFLIRAVSHLLMTFDEALFWNREFDLEMAKGYLRQYVELLRFGLSSAQRP